MREMKSCKQSKRVDKSTRAENQYSLVFDCLIPEVCATRTVRNSQSWSRFLVDIIMGKLVHYVGLLSFSLATEHFSIKISHLW